MQSVITFLIVALAAAFLIRKWIGTFGRKQGCHGCASAGSCSLPKDRARSNEDFITSLPV